MYCSCSYFFVPTFISIILNLAATDDGQIKTCMNAATPEGISIAYSNRATKYVENVKNSLSSNDYFTAMTAISKVDDTLLRDKLNNELSKIKTYVDLMSEIKTLSTEYDYKKIRLFEKEP